MSLKNQKFIPLSIAFIYLLFGGLKLISGCSPAEEIGINTIKILTFSIFSEDLCLYLLSALEIAIGVLLLIKGVRKFAIVIAITHLVLTFTPFIFFPSQVLNFDELSFNLLGQYIIKNIVLIGALLSIYPSNSNKQSITI